jgi:mono/diheme cytochrome c family protein
MIHAFYQFVGSLGYHHPIHPMITHIPVGLTIGALVFALVSLLFRRVQLKLSAWHCALLAIVGVVPTALFGYLDWQEKYHGIWSTQIKLKIIFAVALFVFLLVALLLGRKRPAEAEKETPARPWHSPRSIAALVLYGICFLLVVGLGLEGGDLVYGNASAASTSSAPTDALSLAGQKVFTDNCSSCHAGGGNTINGAFPLSKAPQLASQSAFVAFLRAPKARDGSDNQMSPFAVADLSEADAGALYSYVVKAFAAK